MIPTFSFNILHYIPTTLVMLAAMRPGWIFIVTNTFLST